VSQWKQVPNAVEEWLKKIMKHKSNSVRAGVRHAVAAFLLSSLYVAIRICDTLMRRPERGLGNILVSPGGDWNFDHDHSKKKR
jgi:hypothetical protein